MYTVRVGQYNTRGVLNDDSNTRKETRAQDRCSKRSNQERQNHNRERVHYNVMEGEIMETKLVNPGIWRAIEKNEKPEPKPAPKTDKGILAWIREK